MLRRAYRALALAFIDRSQGHKEASPRLGLYQDMVNPPPSVLKTQAQFLRQEMQKLPETGKVKNIGVSNFGIKNLEKLLNHPSCKIAPAVNQIELHPNNPSPKLVAYCKEKNIHCTGYSCLGSTDSPLYRDPTLLKMAEKIGKTPQQSKH